jgi:hypothetical protein
MNSLIHDGRLETPVFELVMLILAITWLWILILGAEE